MGVYSPNILLHFPEQFRQFTYFNMTPKINSGYIIDNNFLPQKLWGILQNSLNEIKESNGNLVKQINEFLWTDSALDIGKYVQFDAIIYRIIPSNDWINEGGFTRYTIDRMVGDNGTPDLTDWTKGLGGVPI